jgi:hypothetical protein
VLNPDLLIQPGVSVSRQYLVPGEDQIAGADADQDIAWSRRHRYEEHFGRLSVIFGRAGAGSKPGVSGGSHGVGDIATHVSDSKGNSPVSRRLAIANLDQGGRRKAED